MRRFLAIATCLVASGAMADHELEGRDLDRGQALYGDYCAACHGANLEGQPDWQTPGADGVLPAPPHDETGHTWHHDNQLLFDYTKEGGAEALAARGVSGFPSGMPAFADSLSDEEIWDILAYIRSTWPKRIQDIHADRNPRHD
ncbi:MAG: hypothetical protein EpisKO_42250 [Epibacterium sp.]